MQDDKTEKKRTTGRPSTLERLGLTPEQVVSVYRSSGTEKAAAEKLGCTHRTVRKILHQADVWPVRINRTRTGCTHKPSKVYYWLVEHQGVIPRNVAEIARQSGIQEMTIRKFLSRRKEAALDYLKVLGKISTLENIQLVSIKGQRFLTQQVAQVELELDQYDLTVTLDCMLKSGVAVHCRLSYVEYTRLFPQKPVEPTYFGEEQNDFATRLADPRSSSLSGS